MNSRAVIKNALSMQFKNLLVVPSVVLLAALSVHTHAAPGDVDLSFDPGSDMNGGVRTIVVQSDGNVLIGGSFTTIRNAYRGRVARLNADGSTDHSFLGDLAGADGYVQRMAVQPDGKVLISGGFSAVNGLTRTRIARLNADGSLDSSFEANLSVNPSSGSFSVNSLALQGDGKVLIGGQFITVGGVVCANIARRNSDGSLDTSFVCSTGGGYPGYASVDCIVIHSDGKSVFGGWFTTVNGISRSRLARLNANGSLDTSFLPVLGGGGTGAGFHLAAGQRPSSDWWMVLHGQRGRSREYGPAQSQRVTG